jgi:ATP-dependent protease ClpP protease subunit
MSQALRSMDMEVSPKQFNWTASKGLKMTESRKRKRSVSRKRGARNDDDDDDEDDDDGEEGDDPMDPEALQNKLRGKLSDLFGQKRGDRKGQLNHIYFEESVNKRSCRDLIDKIEDLNIKLGKLTSEYQLTDPPKIYLHINSFGGSIFAAFSVIDTMRRSRFPIVTIIEGASASAATLISVFGSERWITKHGYMLIHQLSSVCWGKMAEIEDEYDNLKDMMDAIYAIYEEKTTMTKAQLKTFLKHDRWWGSDKCLEKGLVDKII